MCGEGLYIGALHEALHVFVRELVAATRVRGAA